MESGIHNVEFHSIISQAELTQDKFVIVELTLIVASWVMRARGREIRRFVIEFKASYFFLNSYIWCFLFEKVTYEFNNTLNLKYKEVRDQFLENLGFPIHFL